MKRILVTGATGMLGSALVERLKGKYAIFATASRRCSALNTKKFTTFNLQQDNYTQLISWSKPNIILHCAALTNVDECEKDPKKCMLINAESVRKLLKFAPEAKIIFISSDAVFPEGVPLANENTRVSPINMYGKSKAKGEKYLLSDPKNHCIIRTTIVGTNLDPQRISFADRIINSATDNTPISLFRDVLFTPISIWKFSEYIEWIIEHQVPSILHIAGSEIASKYLFGYNLCRALGLNTTLIKPISLSKVKLMAQRKYEQTLSSKLFEKISGYQMPTLDETIDDFVNRRKNERNQNR